MADLVDPGRRLMVDAQFGGCFIAIDQYMEFVGGLGVDRSGVVHVGDLSDGSLAGTSTVEMGR